MKRFFLFFLTFAVALTVACKKKQAEEADASEQTQSAGATYTAKAAPPANADILWYNNNAPKELRLNAIKPSKNSKSGYEVEDDPFTEVSVADIKNGYILSGYSGVGQTAIALYLSNTGVFIGKEEYWFGNRQYGFTLNFYEVKNTQWTDVTADILPVTVDNFFDKDAIAKDWAVVTAALENRENRKIKKLSDLFRIRGELPRYGTDITVSVFAAFEDIKGGSKFYFDPFMASKDGVDGYNYTDSEIAAYERIWAAAKKFTLAWNMSTGKFDVKKGGGIASEEGIAFLNKFYQELHSVRYDEQKEYARKHITKKAEKMLIEAYQYPCDTGDCWAIATLDGMKGGMDPGPFKERVIEPIGDNTYRVTTKHEYEVDDKKEVHLRVQVSLVKEGDSCKIDSIKEEPPQYR